MKKLILILCITLIGTINHVCSQENAKQISSNSQVYSLTKELRNSNFKPNSDIYLGHKTYISPQTFWCKKPLNVTCFVVEAGPSPRPFTFTFEGGGEIGVTSYSTSTNIDDEIIVSFVPFND